MRNILELMAYYKIFLPSYQPYVSPINELIDKNQLFTSRTQRTPLAFTYNATDYHYNLLNLHPKFRPLNQRIPRLNYSLQLNDIREAHAALTQIQRDKTFVVQSWLSLDKHQDDYLESFNAVLSTIPPILAVTIPEDFNCNYTPEQFNENLLPKVTELLHMYAAMHILKS